MPLYEYHCDACGQNFEKLQRFSDEPFTLHEECGGGPVHRLISTSALQFKGTGFYITDYKKSNSSNTGKDSKSEGGSSSANSGESSGGSGDAKKKSSDSAPAPAPASSSDTKSKSKS